jgi:hypothetical protein
MFFRTGRTEYRDGISKQAYYIFKRDKDAGISRLRLKQNSARNSHPA